MTKLQTGIIGAIVVAGIVAPLAIQHQAAVKLSEQDLMLQQQREQVAHLVGENQRLSNQMARVRMSVPRLPAPRMPAATAPADAPTEDSQSTRLILELLHSDKPLRLSTEQVASFLEKNHRSAASLLAAFRTTRDRTLLQEAIDKYPTDPQVAYVAVYQMPDRRHWLDGFKQSAPDNALANYISALDYFQAGQTDLAVQDLIAASRKPECQDYSLNWILSNDEAFRAAGYSEAEAKAISSMSLELPSLAGMKNLSHNIADLANSYRQAGDTASAQAALQMDLNLGQSLESQAGGALITKLVGIAIENIGLKAMDPSSPYGAAGQTVRDRLDQLAHQSATLKHLVPQTESLMPTMSAQDWISYNDRWRAFGEAAAAKWLIDKYGGH